MSKAFPTDKDNIIDDMDDDFDLNLSEDEYDHLRKLSRAELYLVSGLMSRAVKKSLEKVRKE